MNKKLESERIDVYDWDELDDNEYTVSGYVFGSNKRIVFSVVALQRLFRYCCRCGVFTEPKGAKYKVRWEKKEF